MKFIRHCYRVLLFLLVCTCIFTSIPSLFAAEEHTIVNLFNNAWITRQGSTNQSSGNVGDVLRHGDRLETLRGNTARISLDSSRQNLIFIAENTIIEINDSDLRMGLTLIKGRIFASLKKLKDKSTFKVMTPMAVATVRGTQFEVSLSDDDVQFLDYSGSVEVARVGPDGEVSKDNVLLKPGERVKVEKLGTSLKNEEINSADMNRLEATARELEEAFQEPPAQPEKNAEDKKDEPKKGFVVKSSFDSQ